MNQVKLIIDGLYDDYLNATDPHDKAVILKEIAWLRSLESDSDTPTPLGLDRDEVALA